jgi:hypothetical protein
MIAASRPSPRSSMAVDHRVPAVFRSVLESFPVAGAAAGLLFGFLCFMPYPAIPVGNATGVQTGSLISLALALPWMLAPWRSRPLILSAVILAPLTISSAKVAFTDGAELDLCFKSLLVTGLAGVSLLAAQRVTPRHALAVLTGIAAATLIHVAVGFWQMYSFSRGQFPLLWLYVNPAFLSVQENVDTIVKYIRRPFGLFPEPSAMSSSLAPWVLFWVAEALGLVRLKGVRPATWQRAMFVIAALGATALIIVSNSGHAAVTLAALVGLVGLWFVRCRATSNNYLAILLVFCVAMPLLLWLGATTLSERVGSEVGSGMSRGDSWHDRALSLKVGFDLLVDGGPVTLFFGLGSGLTSPRIKEVAGFEAVWSVLLPYIYQTGVIGLVAIGYVAIELFRNWRAVAYSGVFAAVLGVWLVGVTVTTSYGCLLPLWVALGWLTVWPDVCESPRRATAAKFVSMSEPSSSSRRPGSRRPPQRVSLLPAGQTGAPSAAAELLAQKAVSRIGDGGEGALS